MTTVKTKKINPLNIETTAGTQARVSIRPTIVDEYAADMKAGVPVGAGGFPALTVFAEKGSERYILADGFHTRMAYMAVHKDKGIMCDVREGTIWDARVYAAGANAAHGERRRDKDIRNAIHMLLLDPHSEGWADTVIADYAKCHRTTVAKVREEMIIAGELESKGKRKHIRDGKEVTADERPKADTKEDKPKADAKPAEPPKAKTQDEFDREAIVDAIKTLASAVCPGADALERYNLQDQLDLAEIAANWLDEMLAASDEEEEKGEPVPKKAQLTSDDEAFLKVS